MIKFRQTLAALAGPVALGAFLAAAIGGAGYPSAAVAADAPKDAAPKCAYNSKFVEKFKPAQDAAQKSDFATALAGAKEAYALAKLPCEQDIAVRLQRSSAYQIDKTSDDVIAAAELMNTLPMTTATDKQQNLGVIMQSYLTRKEYDKSIPAMKAYLAVSGPNPEVTNNLIEVQHQQGDCTGMIETITASTKTTPASERQLLLEQDCYFKAKDEANRTVVMEQLVTRFPKRNYLIDLLHIYLASNADERAILNIYRLGYSKDLLTGAGEIIDYADYADKAGISAEAQKVLEKASAEKWITLDDKNTKMLAGEKRSAAEDKKGLPALDKEARAGSSGRKDIAVGYAYFGFEDYANAVEAIKRGLSAGRVSDVKRTDDANMVLGIALLRLGKTDEASAAFTAAQADARMAKAAALWLGSMKNGG